MWVGLVPHTVVVELMCKVIAIKVVKDIKLFSGKQLEFMYLRLHVDLLLLSFQALFETVQQVVDLYPGIV